MASLSDMLLQASMRSPNAGAGTTIAILVSFLLEAALKTWKGRRSAYRKLADDLAGWAVFAGDNPCVPVADGLRPRGVLGKALAVLPICHIPAKTGPVPDGPAVEKALGRAWAFMHGFRFGNRYQYAKRLLRNEGIDFKVSQGFMHGFICVQQSELAHARAVLGDAGLPVPALLVDTPMTINARHLDALGMGSQELAQALEGRGFDASAREESDEVVVTFDEAHDAAALTSALCALQGEPEPVESVGKPQTGLGNEPDGEEIDNDLPAEPLHDYYKPVTDAQVGVIDRLMEKGKIDETHGEDLMGMTSGQITDYLNAHPDLGVPKLERNYKNGPHPYSGPEKGGAAQTQTPRHMASNSLSRSARDAAWLSEVAEASAGAASDRTLVKAEHVEAPGH